MNVLALVTDAFGGRGGIALYNRNVLTALACHPARPRVTALARIAPNRVGELPAGLNFMVGGRNNKLRFAAEVLRAALGGRGADLIVCGHLNLLPLAEVARRISGAPLMLFVYGLDAWSQSRPFSARLLRHVDATISIRQYTLDLMGQWAHQLGRSYVLENAIHLRDYRPGPKPVELERRYGLEGKRVLMTLGRTDDPNFGFDEILDVLPTLAQRVPNLAYVIAGSGQDLDRLKEKARSRVKPDQVVFTGEVAEFEKAEHYRLADAFAMPGTAKGVRGLADFDTYPLRFSFLEAMACGIPVVGTRPEDPAELARSPVPVLYVDSRDPTALVEGLATALNRGPGAVPQELSRYDFPNFCSRLHAIVDETLGRRRAKAGLPATV